jgi:hypothetical protein
MKPSNPSKASPCPGCFRFSEPGCPLFSRDDGQNRGRPTPRRIVFFQAAAALLPPALGFAAGFGLTGLFFPLSGEGARAAGGTVFMFLSALGVYLFRRFPPEFRNHCN